MANKESVILTNGKTITGAGIQLEYCIVDTVSMIIGIGTKYCNSLDDYPEHVRDQAAGAAQRLLKKIPDVINAYHSSDDNLPQKYQIDRSKDNIEAKTDVVVVDSNRKYYKISVKMSGAVQLTSTQGVSTAKVFRKVFIACGVIGLVKMIVHRKMIEMVHNMPTKLLSQKRYNEAVEKDRKSNLDSVSHMVSNGYIKKEFSYDSWIEENKPSIVSRIAAIFDTDRRFKKNLIVEAISGSGLHGKDSASTAEYFLSPTGFHKINKQFANKIIDRVSFGIRAKGSKITNRVVFRLDFVNDTVID